MADISDNVRRALTDLAQRGITFSSTENTMRVGVSVPTTHQRMDPDAKYDGSTFTISPHTRGRITEEHAPGYQPEGVPNYTLTQTPQSRGFHVETIAIADYRALVDSVRGVAPSDSPQVRRWYGNDNRIRHY